LLAGVIQWDGRLGLLMKCCAVNLDFFFKNNISKMIYFIKIFEK
jgi:hypothetical protein